MTREHAAARAAALAPLEAMVEQRAAALGAAREAAVQQAARADELAAQVGPCATLERHEPAV
jgi:hypothetical protein